MNNDPPASGRARAAQMFLWLGAGALVVFNLALLPRLFLPR
jgi:hypothetical protein